MMKFEIWNCNIWNVISSLSTLAAVIVSLWLANRKKKIRRKLHITEQFRENYFRGEICLLITAIKGLVQKRLERPPMRLLSALPATSNGTSYRIFQHPVWRRVLDIRYETRKQSSFL